MTIAVGIDLGTTNSCVAVATPTGVEFGLGPQGERVHPSVVAYPEHGNVIVGHEARPLRVVEPESTIYSAKRLIGQNIRSPLVQLALSGLTYPVEEGPNQQPIVVVRDRRLTVPEVSSQVLMHLKRCCERQMADRVTQAVITVPANFSDSQRRATQEAGRLAGLEVLRLINEPTAAALAYGFGQRKDEIVCVYDFGGGTFDVSLLQIRGEIFEVLATDGDFFLGGDDIDRTITEYLAAEMTRTRKIDPRGVPSLLARIQVAAEEVKRHLSDHALAEGTIDGLEMPDGKQLTLPFRLSRSQLESLMTGYIDRTMELCRAVLTSAGKEPKDISEILCVGGSTRIPMVRQRLAELFMRAPQIKINPDEVVAQGAAIQAGSLSGNLIAGTGMAARDAVPTSAISPLQLGDASPADPLSFSIAKPLPRPLLLDVTPATMGIATAGGYCERLLEKNAPIPIERTKVFTTARDDQTKVVIDCCRGEQRRYSENEPLGQLVIEDLPVRKRSEVKIEVTFRVDTDGILHVRARDVATGAAREVSLTILGAPTTGENVSDGPWEVPQLIAWLRQMGPKVDLMGPFELLDLSPTDDYERIRAGYHRIAATRHPDLFRNRLGQAETETLMRLFARVTGAYAQLRDPEVRRKFGAKPSSPVPAQPGAAKPGDTPTGLRKISPRALSHVRRAEALLKTGDVASAILHLRMAVAAEPNVKELRKMLSDTEQQLKK